MSGTGDAEDPDRDAHLADLADDLSRRLQSGEGLDPSGLAGPAAEWAMPILALLPTMRGLIRLGREGGGSGADRDDRGPSNPTTSETPLEPR